MRKGSHYVALHKEIFFKWNILLLVKIKCVFQPSRTQFFVYGLVSIQTLHITHVIFLSHTLFICKMNRLIATLSSRKAERKCEQIWDLEVNKSTFKAPLSAMWPGVSLEASLYFILHRNNNTHHVGNPLNKVQNFESAIHLTGSSALIWGQGR